MTARALALALASCAHASGPAATVALRAACGELEYWNGAACAPKGDAPTQLAVGAEALARLDVDQAKVALDTVEQRGPLDYKTHVTLWEQRGIAAAYIDDETGATTAFDMLLALDPSHFLSYELSPKATLVFEKALRRSKLRTPPSVDLRWPRGLEVDKAIPVDVEVLADPKQFLARATLFVRTRGESRWRAADLVLPRDKHLVLPPVAATKSSALEIYLRAYDAKGNEVLSWADPARPREISLRYDPPPPWYFTWWGLTSLGIGTTAIVGTIVYFATRSPADKIDGNVTVRP